MYSVKSPEDSIAVGSYQNCLGKPLLKVSVALFFWSKAKRLFILLLKIPNFIFRSKRMVHLENW